MKRWTLGFLQIAIYTIFGGMLWILRDQGFIKTRAVWIILGVVIALERIAIAIDRIDRPRQDQIPTEANTNDWKKELKERGTSITK